LRLRRRIESGLRPLCAVALAIVSSACALAPPVPQAGLFAPEPAAALLGAEYAQHLAARYASLTGDPVRAADYWSRAFDQAPDDPVLLERAVLALLIAGDGDGALALASGADPQVADAAPHALLVKALGLLGGPRQARATPILTEVAQGDGAFSADSAAAVLASLRLATDPDAALSLLAPRNGANSLSGEAFAVRALLETRAGRPDAARASFREAWRRGVREPLVASAYVKALVAAGETAGAAEIRAAMERNTGFAQARIAWVYESQPDPASGGAAAHARVLYAACSGVSYRSGPELVAVCPTLALMLDPSLDAARIRLAQAFALQSRSEEAIGLLQRLSASGPLASEASLEAAEVYLDADRQAEAIAAAEQALTIAGDDRPVLVRAAEVMRRANAHVQSEALLSRAIGLDLRGGKQDWRLYFARAGERNDLGMWEAAERDLFTALEVEPDQPEVLNFLGYSWVDRGVRVEEGFEMIRKAVEARPNAGYIVDSLGWAHYRRGEYEAAVDALERAAALSPADPEIIDHLGDAYWRVGRREEGTYQWRRALSLSPPEGLGRTIRGKLRDGLPDTPARGGG